LLLFKPFGCDKLSSKNFFYSRLATLLKSGFGLQSALNHIRSDSKTEPESVVKILYDTISAGGTFSAGMKKTPEKFFSAFEISMAESGETSGRLAEIFFELSRHFEFLCYIKNSIINGLLYPVVLLHAAIIIPAVPFLVLKGLIPFFAKALPPLVFLYGLFFGGIYLYKFAKKSVGIAENMDRFLLQLPGLGNLIRKLAIVKFLQSFVSLYSAGAGIIKTVEISAGTAGNLIIKKEIIKSIPLLKKGESFSAAFSGNRYMPPLVKDMLKTGEISGSMDRTLSKVSDYLKEEAEITINKILKILPAAVYLLVALYIGYTVISFFAQYLSVINSLL
jgi:type IV pilus assembly protein PilC